MASPACREYLSMPLITIATIFHRNKMGMLTGIANENLFAIVQLCFTLRSRQTRPATLFCVKKRQSTESGTI